MGPTNDEKIAAIVSLIAESNIETEADSDALMKSIEAQYGEFLDIVHIDPLIENDFVYWEGRIKKIEIHADADPRETAPVAWYVRSMHAAHKDRSGNPRAASVNVPVDVEGDFEALRTTPPTTQVIDAPPDAPAGADSAAAPGVPPAPALLHATSMDPELSLIHI